MAQKADARTVFSKWGSGRRAGLMKEFGAGTPHCAFLLLPQEMPLLRVHGPPPNGHWRLSPGYSTSPPEGGLLSQVAKLRTNAYSGKQIKRLFAESSRLISLR